MKQRIQALLVLVFIFLGSFFPNLPLSYSADVYDYTQAIEYAKTHNNKRCSDRFDFRDYNFGDCAHYVSCCIGNEDNIPGGGLNISNYKDFYIDGVYYGTYYGFAGGSYPINGEIGKKRITQYVDGSYWDWQLITSLENKNLIEKRKHVSDLKPGDIIQYSITDGWCEQSGISLLDKSGDSLDIDSVVKTNTTVYKTPSGNTILSKNPKTGFIIDGPRKKNRKTWWKIRFDNGAESHVVLYLGYINNIHTISDHLFSGGSSHGLDYTTILNKYGYNEARFFSFKDSIRKIHGKGDDDDVKEIGTIRINANFPHENLCAPYVLYRSKEKNGTYSKIESASRCEYDPGKEFEANYYYKVSWGDVPNYTHCGEQVHFLSSKQTIDFYCTYQKIGGNNEEKSIKISNPISGNNYESNSSIQIQWEGTNLTKNIYIWYQYKPNVWYSVASDLSSQSRCYDWNIPSQTGDCLLLVGSGSPENDTIKLDVWDDVTFNVISGNGGGESEKGYIKIKATVGDNFEAPYSLYRCETEYGQYSFVTSGKTGMFDFGTQYDANYYYKVSWGEISGYTKCPDEVKYLYPDHTIEFSCTYQKNGGNNTPSKYEKGDWISIGPSCYYYDAPCGNSRYIFDYENGYCIYQKEFCNEKWWYKIWMQDLNGDYDKFVWIRGIDINKQIPQPLGSIQSEHFFKKGAQAYDNPCQNVINTIKYDGNEFKILDRIYRCNTWWYQVNVEVWGYKVWFMESGMT
jgi:hypothetical protein